MSSIDQAYTPLSQAAALAGLPMLLEKLRRLTRDAEMLKAELYGAALQLDAVAEGLGIQPLQGQPAVTIQVKPPWPAAEKDGEPIVPQPEP